VGGEVAGNVAGVVVQFVEDRFADPSQKLFRALARPTTGRGRR